jgi:hypothetical protein
MKFESFLAGANFRPREARDLVRDLGIGDELTLERDKNNEYDANAIRVLYDGQHLGFIERTVAARLAPFMDSEAVVGLPSTYTCTVIDGGVSPLKPLLEITSAPAPTQD